jgi:uncharacterized membrane protein YhfC
MHISNLSLICMGISAAISIGVPILAFIVFRKKFNAKTVPMLVGIAGFVIFALVLESIIHSIVLGKLLLREIPAAYIIYGIFMAGIFEETARLIGFKILKKKYGGIGTALSYGIGHGGIESVMLAGVPMLLALVAGILVNSGNIEIITSKLQGKTLEAISGQIEQLADTAPYMFLIGSLERMFAITIHISLTIMVYHAVYSGKMRLFPLAILVHAIIDIPAAAMQAGLLENVFIVEGLVGVCAILSALFAKYLHGKQAVANSEQVP